jgi:hypothetical protein
MTKTNIRVNNFFVLFHKGKYYLSDIDILDEWKILNNAKLKNMTKNKDITHEIKELTELHNIHSKVNFIKENFKSFKKSTEGDKLKIITLKGG